LSLDSPAPTTVLALRLTRIPAPLLAVALAVALGVVNSLALVATSMWFLPIACVAAQVVLLRKASTGQAALLGLGFGFGWLAATFWWLFISLHRYGNLPAWLAATAVGALALALSVYWCLMAAFAAWRSGRPLADAVLFAALWLAAELLRTMVLTGFPWGASGYTQIDSPLAAWAPWVGVYGIGFLVAFIGAALALGLIAGRRGWPAVGVAIAIVGGSVLIGPLAFTSSSGSLPVTLLQTNIAQDEKFAAERLPQTLAELADALSDSADGLVVAPETAMPMLPDQLADVDATFWDRLRPRFATPTRAALVGLPLGDFDHGYTNSVIALGSVAGYRYDKAHLVPFGEFIPWGFHWFTRLMGLPLGDFDRGAANAASYAFGGQLLAPNICFEDLFGEELALRFADPARAPTVFVNLSNIGWFGDTSAVAQHLNISRFRAIEFQRPMLRATNTGSTAIIDHHGRVVAALPTFTRASLVGVVEGRSGVTPYAHWTAAAGLWPLVVGVLAILMFSRHGARTRRDGGIVATHPVKSAV
jgi:apolipoprotein N-acyltransferase